VIEGGPGRAESWDELSCLLDRTWPHAHGARLGLAKLAIDTGYESPAVYAWARKVGHAQVAPVKGVEGFNRAGPVVGPTFVDVTEAGRKLRRGARLWTIAVATCKSETYRFLRLERPTDEELVEGAAFPPGFVHLAHGVEAEWVKQLAAAQLVTVRTKRGFISVGLSGRNCASATRRSTVASMRAPRPGSLVRTAGPTRNGATLRIRSGRLQMKMRLCRRATRKTSPQECSRGHRPQPASGAPIGSRWIRDG